MRVISKLAQIDFQFGEVHREGNLLVIDSDPNASMPSNVYVSPQDVLEFLKRFLLSPSALLFVLAFPYFLVRWNRSDKTASRKGPRNKNKWPTV